LIIKNGIFFELLKRCSSGDKNEKNKINIIKLPTQLTA